MNVEYDWKPSRGRGSLSFMMRFNVKHAIYENVGDLSFVHTVDTNTRRHDFTNHYHRSAFLRDVLRLPR